MRPCPYSNSQYPITIRESLISELLETYVYFLKCLHKIEMELIIPIVCILPGLIKLSRGKRIDL